MLHSSAGEPDPSLRFAPDPGWAYGKGSKHNSSSVLVKGQAGPLLHMPGRDVVRACAHIPWENFTGPKRRSGRRGSRPAFMSLFHLSLELILLTQAWLVLKMLG